jgi:putative ABC transport system ATP-binding protein
MNERPPTIELAGVHRTFGSGATPRVLALDGVDLSIAPAQFVSVEGPSGCGKTTLLNVIGLIDVPTGGELRWDGVPIQRQTDAQRSRLRLTSIGFIFQRFYLLPTLTALENVELPMRAARVAAAPRRARASALLDEVGLSHRRDAFPHELSGGEEQRVAIARALANEPKLLLADEPTGELDRANTDVVLDLLVKIHATRPVSIVLVTHNPRVAARADRHLTMADGKVVADVSGTPGA